MEQLATVTTAQKINDLHQGLEKTMRVGIETAIEIGHLLTETKAELKHGEWGKWVQDNLTFTSRTATNYMRLYAERSWVLSVRNMAHAYAVLSGEIGNVSDLNREKKDQGNVLADQIGKICSITDSLCNKVTATNTALKELGEVENPDMAFNVIASFSNLFSSVTTMLTYFGVDFKAEIQKPAVCTEQIQDAEIITETDQLSEFEAEKAKGRELDARLKEQRKLKKEAMVKKKLEVVREALS